MTERNAFAAMMAANSAKQPSRKRPRQESAAARAPQSGFVSCPICSRRMFASALDGHLDKAHSAEHVSSSQEAAATPNSQTDENSGSSQPPPGSNPVATAPQREESLPSTGGGDKVQSKPSAFATMMQASAAGSFAEEMWLLHNAADGTFEWGKFVWCDEATLSHKSLCSNTLPR